MSNSLQLTNAELLRSALSTAGLGRNVEDMDTTTEADLRNIVRDGLRRFFFPMVGDFPYRWRWLQRFFPVSVVPFFTDGTIGIGTGTVTLAGANWPSYAADCFIAVAGNIVFLTERVNNATATTDNTELVVDAGTEYTLYRYRYPLPADFAEFIGDMTYKNGTDVWHLAGADEAELRLRYQINYNYNNRTTHYAITFTPEGSANIEFWPVPPAGAYISSLYVKTPEDNLPDDLTIPDVDPIIQCAPMYANCAIEAVLASAEAYNNNTVGIHEARFQAALAAAVAHDKSASDGIDFSHNLRGRPAHQPYPTMIDFSGI